MPKKTIKKVTKTKETKITDFFNGTIFVQYSTANLNRAIEFYSGKLDFEPSDFSKSGPDPEKVGLYEFKLPSNGAILTLSKEPAEKIVVNDNLVIMVNKIDNLWESLTNKEINPTEIKDVPNLLSFFTIKDPDGNTIMFMSDPRKK